MGRSSREKAERRGDIRRLEDQDLARSQNRNLPPQQQAFQLQVQGTRFQGPLPPPEILLKYNEVLPGAAERIIAMAERNQAHRQMLEAKVIPGGIISERIGQFSGLAIYLATLVAGTYMVINNKDVFGISEMLASTGVFAGLYLKAQHDKKLEMRGKQV